MFNINLQATTKGRNDMADMMSLAIMQLPYNCLNQLGWEAAVSERLRQASKETGISGAFLLVASPHGYEFQHVAVLYSDGSAEGAVWTNLTGEKQTWPIDFRHNATQSLERMKSDWQERRIYLGSERDPTRGRNVVVFVAANGHSDWITCQTPLTNAAELDELDELILDLQSIPKPRSNR
jgi:hypothetical protein